MRPAAAVNNSGSCCLPLNKREADRQLDMWIEMDGWILQRIYVLPLSNTPFTNATDIKRGQGNKHNMYILTNTYYDTQ